MIVVIDLIVFSIFDRVVGTDYGFWGRIPNDLVMNKPDLDIWYKPDSGYLAGYLYFSDRLFNT